MSFDEFTIYLKHPAVMGILAIVFLAILWLLFRFRRERPPRYTACASLLTDAEKAFHTALEAAVAGRYRIMCKVRMADIVQPAAGLEQRERRSALGRISSKHLDFVLCDHDHFVIAAAIELDDRSHLRKERRERDIFVEDVFDEAGIPLVRFPVRRDYAPADIFQQIDDTIAGRRNDS